MTVILLVEQTLATCLFGCEPTPSVVFISQHHYTEIAADLLYRLELDPNKFNLPDQRRLRTPSPIRRMQDTHLVNNNDTSQMLFLEDET